MLLAPLVLAIPVGLASNAHVGRVTRQPSEAPSLCSRLAARWRELPASALAEGFTPQWSGTVGVVVPQGNTLRDQRFAARAAQLWNAYPDYGVALPWDHTDGEPDASARHVALYGASHRRFRRLPGPAVRAR